MGSEPGSPAYDPTVGTGLVSNGRQLSELLIPALEIKAELFLSCTWIGATLRSVILSLGRYGWCQQLIRDVSFLGKTLVASAGVTVMAAFPQSKRIVRQKTDYYDHARYLYYVSRNPKEVLQPHRRKITRSTLIVSHKTRP
jgi:hypothetical protein